MLTHLISLSAPLRAIEDGFHDFDESCLGCDIVREYTEGAPDCPAATCTDTSGEDAYITMIEKDCASDCSTDECTDLFLTLRVVHDDCPDIPVFLAGKKQGMSNPLRGHVQKLGLTKPDVVQHAVSVATHPCLGPNAA